MNIIRAVDHQKHKAEYAYQLEMYFKKQGKLDHLFVGATSSTTVCNVLAAMIDLPVPVPGTGYQLDLTQVFDSLYQGFLLLIVKEVTQASISQAEQLIMASAVCYAKHIQACAADLEPSMVDKSQRLLNAMAQLEQQRSSQRKSRHNMGRTAG